MAMRALRAAKFVSKQNFQLNAVRFYSTLPSETKVAAFATHGTPESVLRLETISLNKGKPLGSNQVLVRMLAAPINPADLNIVEGVYGDVKVNLPCVGGNEGVAVVEQVGSDVQNFKPNDWVIPARPGFGTWRTHAVCDTKDVMRVRNDIPAEYAAVLSVNPCTAIRLLEDFAELKPGDVIVQNGGNSLVGQSVIQMARKRGIKTISIIRNRPEQTEIIDRLKQLGGDIVVTEEYARTAEMQRVISDLPAPKLALNCVGGESSTTLARLLGQNGTLVTYGAMAKKPVTIPSSLLIFKNITSRGFWLTKWLEQQKTLDKKQEMINEAAEMVKERELVLYLERHKFSNFNAALKKNAEYSGRKVVLTMN